MLVAHAEREASTHQCRQRKQCAEEIELSCLHALRSP